MWHIFIAVGILVCAVMAIRAKKLLVSALWLAGTSALVALAMYLLGAPEIAVIELSVGAGLVTVLFVFAINLTGEETFDMHVLIPRPVAWGMVIVAVGLLVWLIVPGVDVAYPNLVQMPFAGILWSDRALDVLLQVVLIFSGVLGILGLLSEPEKESHHSSSEEKNA